MKEKKQGEYLFGSNFLKARTKISLLWKKLLKEARFEHRKLYITRHSFASIMLNSGEEPLWVSGQLGHKNLAITYSVYTKYMKNEKKQRATFLEEAFGDPIEDVNITKDEILESLGEKNQNLCPLAG